VSGRRLLIFANGVLPDADAARALLRQGDRVICADAGARHARQLGLRPDLVVGDLDSLQADDRDWLLENGVRVIQYPHDKDQTDLELAIQHGLLEAPESIVILGALGARLDHTLGNIALLADERISDGSCTIDDGVEQVLLCRGRVAIQGSPGDLVSLLPWGTQATGVWTSGLKWQLRGEILLAERSRGVSNEMTAQSAEISIESGLLFVIHRRRLREAQAGE
jgi:thiamine pyrophosphokinase